MLSANSGPGKPKEDDTAAFPLVRSSILVLCLLVLFYEEGCVLIILTMTKKVKEDESLALRRYNLGCLEPKK